MPNEGFLKDGSPRDMRELRRFPFSFSGKTHVFAELPRLRGLGFKIKRISSLRKDR